MHGYTASTYGDAFADVYDEWYAHLADGDGIVACATRWAVPGPVLELGVGTGRLAAPLCAAGFDVVGVDASAAMLARATAPGPGSLTTIHGDMADDLPDGPFGLALCGFNTLFNLVDAGHQRRCVDEVARRLAPGAALVVEAAIVEAATASSVEVRAIDVASVTLSVSRADAATQRVEGQFVTIAADGITMRPWALRWLSPAQLDELAAAAGLVLVERTRTFGGEPFDPAAADRHVSVYRAADPARSSNPAPMPDSPVG